MFEAVIERASLLKKIIDAVKELSKEVSLVCDEKGIKLRVMDSSHVSLTDLHMAEAAFLDYRCDSRKVLGMNLEHMKKIFTLCNNEDKVTMKCEDDGSHLLFTFEALDERVSHFELKLLDLECEELGVPDGTPKCTVKMPAADLQKIVRDFQNFGETTNISVNKAGVIFTTAGDIGKGDVVVKPRDSEKESDRVEVSCTEPVAADFSTRYLNFFTKATSLSSVVTLHLSDDTPLQIKYDVENEESGFLCFYLAPKVEADE
jgi:proliferating cell nuclear antigen